jgi:hypothetical protein
LSPAVAARDAVKQSPEFPSLQAEFELLPEHGEHLKNGECLGKVVDIPAEEAATKIAVESDGDVGPYGEEKSHGGTDPMAV